MKSKIFVFAFEVLVTLNLAAQQTELKDIVGKIQSACTKVEASSKTYEQEIKLIEFSSLNYSVAEVDAKGNRTTLSYDFNLADIDPNTVRQVTQKDVIKAVLSVRNKQKLIKYSKNGEAQSYDDELSIYAKDPDQAKQLVELFKKAIPLGEKITNAKLKLNGYQEMVTWLIDHVKNVTAGNKSFTQNLQPGSYVGSLVLTQVENDGKTSQQEEFAFNMADINLNAINFEISGNRFGLNLEMLQKIKSVKVTRDGKSRPFNDEVLIYTNNVDEARDLKT
ncbi:MAG: hypothetical protein ACKOE6_14145, partial [Flammeovirgaceae bacterium]